MAEKQEEAVPGKEAKKKKAKRNVSSKPSSGMAGSSSDKKSARQGRTSTSDGVDEQRRRSRSADKKARRDSGTKRRGSGISGGKGMSGSSGRQQTQTGSPLRVRKTKSEGVGAEHHTTSNKSSAKGERAAAMVRDRSRSKSPTPEKTGGGSPPRLPQRTVSESSNLQSNLQALSNRGNKGNNKESKADNFDEASLGDFKKYSSQDKHQQRTQLKMGGIPEESLGSFMAFATKYEEEALLGLHDDDDEIEAPYGPDKKQTKKQLMQQQQQQQTQNNDQSASLGALMNPTKKYGGLGDKAAANVGIEASMGSITAFMKKSPDAQTQNEQSASLGALMNPMGQYGGGGGRGKGPSMVDESLGSFTAFNKKYEEDKLLGLQGSTLSAMMESASPLTKESAPPIVEESMGDFVQIASKEEETETEQHSKPKAKEEEEKEKEFDAVSLPTSRIKNLGNRGGVGYRIMVDSPGGHFLQPMKIVVAIEFEDETDSDECDDDHSDDDENDNPVEQAEGDDEPHGLGQPKESFDQANEIDDSAHLPMTPLEEDIGPNDHGKVPGRRKKHKSRLSGEGKLAGAHDDADDHHSDEEDDEVAPLAANINSRWNHRTSTGGGHTLRQPEREKSSHSSSTHSTVSSVTIESFFDGAGGVSIESDACPSNANALQRRPVARSRVTSASLKRSSGAVRSGGTAALLAKSLAPHNLGTRRGLMLRQQSEASMKSTGTSKSNDSSWAGNNNDVPEDYQASFMQLNLVDLDKTQIQTNEEVENSELPEELRSGVEDIGKKGSNDKSQSPGTGEPGPVAEGKDPSVAATELLGMKTMLKHIKRVAPRRSKSFEFDRDMPKQMWNKMFSKSQKGALPGSQYVDHGDDSTSGHDDEGENEKIQSTRGEESDEQQKAVSSRSTDDNGDAGDAPSTRGTGGLFSSIIRVTGSGPAVASTVTDKSGSKGKSSFFTSAMKRVIPSTTKGTTSEETDQEQEQADEKDDDDDDDDGKDAAVDASEGSLELDGILKELDRSLMSVEHEPEPGEHGAPSTDRRKAAERPRERSRRGDRTHGPPKKGATARSRAARAQHVHNRSLRDTLDFLSTEQDEEDLPQLDAVKEDESKVKPRPRARRKPPLRTRSDESGPGRAPPARTKSSDGTKGLVGRARSHDGSSPLRPSRDATKKMHSSFSGVDPSDLPIRSKPGREPPARTKSRDGGFGVHQHKDNPSRTSSRADKGTRAAGRKQRPARKKSVTETVEEPEPINLGLKIPENATENEVRELLDYH